VSEEFALAYNQLLDGDEILDRRRQRLGISSERLDELTDVLPQRPFDRLTEQLIGLTRIVEALGGHVEVRAVFDDETILLLREPPAADG